MMSVLLGGHFNSGGFSLEYCVISMLLLSGCFCSLR